MLDAEVLRFSLAWLATLRRSFITVERIGGGAYAGFLDGFLNWYHRRSGSDPGAGATAAGTVPLYDPASGRNRSHPAQSNMFLRVTLDGTWDFSSLPNSVGLLADPAYLYRARWIRKGVPFVRDSQQLSRPFMPG